MPRNSSGVYSLPQSPFVAGTVISSAAVNSNFSDIATALTGSLPTNGSTGMTGQLKNADGSTAQPSVTFTTDLTTGFSHQSNQISVSIAGVSIGTFTSSGYTGAVQGTVPVGTVADFAGATAPSQWYLCFGQAVSRTTFAALFTALSTTWGSGDGVTTFNLPDLRGIVTAGVDNMGGSAASRLTATFFGTSADALAATGGNQSRTLITANLPPYTPSGSVSTATNDANANFVGIEGGDNQVASGSGFELISRLITSNFSGSAQGGTSTAFATIQPTTTMNKIIYAAA